ncbi:hypothetical protein DH2020_038850 [Rehmannia glutinosa]|uniref:AT-rich interactive domain-containing protein n=1 Tax=Rehmannia glutinosa TaxID=99300 RepID=A0ABR0UZ31_REHGL
MEMEDNKEAVQDALGGSDEQQTQHVESKESHEFKDMEVDNEIENKYGEKSVDSRVFQVEKKILPSIYANAQKLCSESVALTDVKDEVQEEKLENDSTTTGDVQKDVRIKMEVVANNVKEEPNYGVFSETKVQPAADIKTPSKSFLLDANDVTGDESGTEEVQAAFMKEVDNFHRERCLDFKPPKFYQEPLNCLKLWRVVIRFGGYERVTSLKLWRLVGESFKPPKTCTTVSWTFRGFYEKALLEYEKHKMRSGELPFSKDKNPITTPKSENQLRNIGLLKRKGSSPVERRVASKSELEIRVADAGVPADWVKVNVKKMKDCYDVYTLVHGLLREELRVQSDPAGRLVISGQPGQQDNPWGVTPFKKLVSLPTRIDAHQTSAVVTLRGQLFVRAPFEQADI